MVAGTSLTIGDIGKIHRDFRERGQGLSGASVGIAEFSRRWQAGAEKVDMARKCHRQGGECHSIFFGEQFWGRAARASWTRKSLGRSLFFGIFSGHTVQCGRLA